MPREPLLSMSPKAADSWSLWTSCRETEYQSTASSALHPGISASKENQGTDLHGKSVLDTKLGNLFPTQRLHELLDADCMPEDSVDTQDEDRVRDSVPLTPCPTVCTMSTSSMASGVGSLPYSLSDLADLDEPPEKRLSAFSSFKSYLEHTLKRRS
mmetsp:Transcript_76779/g.156092  ORF Transcript_76779/g.156092 Transcript_76779/m.156092 type:complete len:156 (-) Transcript_76779:157-624(-)